MGRVPPTKGRPSRYPGRGLGFPWRRVAATSVIAVALPAAGRPAERTVRITYTAPSSCPAKDHLAQRIQARTRHARVVQQAPADFALDVAIGPQGLRGQLQVQTKAGAQAQRVVNGASCAEVVEAAALIAAITIDPEAASSSAPQPAPARPEAATVSGSVPPAQSRPASAARPAAHTNTDRRPHGWWIGTGVGPFVVRAVAPKLTYGLSLYGEIGLARGEGDSATLRFTLLRAQRSNVQGELGDAEFTWTAGRLSGCPTRWPRSSIWHFSSCLFLEGGVLEGAGMNIFPRDSATTRWWATGATGRLQAVLANAITLEAELGPVVPLTRDVFYFEGTPAAEEIYRPPSVGWFAGLALGGKF